MYILRGQTMNPEAVKRFGGSSGLRKVTSGVIIWLIGILNLPTKFPPN